MNRGGFIRLLEEAREELEKIPNLSFVFIPKALKYFGSFGDRCVIFRIFQREALMCELVGGLPEGRHNVGLIDPLARHPDIANVVQDREVFFIRDPLQFSLAAYFREIIEKEGISQILYVPIIVPGKIRMEWVIKWVVVIDVCGKKSFSVGDTIYCGELEAFFSFRIWKEKNPAGEWSAFVLQRKAALLASCLPC